MNRTDRPRLSRRIALRWITSPLGLTGLVALHPTGLWAAVPPPSRLVPSPAGKDSIYALRVPMEDQNGQAFQLADARGHLVLVSMFYSACDAVCPMIFETIRLVLRQLPAAAQAQVRVVMVTFDPGRDTVAVLKKTATAHEADGRWTLARPSEADARQVAAVLGVQYRRLASGEFNHSSSIFLLDREGQIALRSNTLGTVDTKLVAALKQLSAR